MQIRKVHCAFVFVMACFCIAIGGCTSPLSQDSSSDVVLVTVGDTKITQSQVDGMAAEYLTSVNSNSTQPDQDTKRQILCTLVKDEVLTQDAKEHGITVSEEEVNKQVDETRLRFPSEDEFTKALTREGLTLNLFKHHVRMNMITQELEKKVRTQSDSSDEALLTYIKAHNSELVSRRSSHILFKPEDEKLAREILQRIKNGEDLGKLAQECSECPSKQQSGDLGWDCKTTFVAPFQEALNKLDKGEVSDLVKTEFGWHIIKCTDIYNPTNVDSLTLDQVPSEVQQVARQRMVSERRTSEFHEYTHNLLQTMITNNKIVMHEDAHMSADDLLQWDSSTNPVK